MPIRFLLVSKRKIEEGSESKIARPSFRISVLKLSRDPNFNTQDQGVTVTTMMIMLIVAMSHLKTTKKRREAWQLCPKIMRCLFMGSQSSPAELLCDFSKLCSKRLTKSLLCLYNACVPMFVASNSLKLLNNRFLRA